MTRINVFNSDEELARYCKRVTSNQTFCYGNAQKSIADYLREKEVKLFKKINPNTRGLKKWEEVTEIEDRLDVTNMMVGIDLGVWCFIGSLSNQIIYLGGKRYTIKFIKMSPKKDSKILNHKPKFKLAAC